MQIQTFILGYIKTNCYFLINEKQEVIIIDPPDQASTIIDSIKKQNLKPVAILLTHGHFDHIMATNGILEHYKIPVYAHEEEKDLLADSILNGANLIRRKYVLTVSNLIKDSDILNISDFSIQVIHTPGHTRGSVCYYFFKEEVIFSGDTLFYESVGRTDFPTGDFETLINSVKNKLLTIPDHVKVYPGHGESTTIGHEKVNNPFLSDTSYFE